MSSPIVDRYEGKQLKGMYILEKKVGAGGFGAVYRARHAKLGSMVAVKYLLPHADATSRERFDREARVSASIVHPNVARVIDIDHDEEGSPFIVMEWVAGKSLRQLLHERGALTFGESLEIAHQFCSAMDAAHGKGIIHRDLKPENLMLTDEGGVVLLKVLDFGIARVAGSSGTLTQGSVIGTPAYVAPETVKSGAKIADVRSDVYAMGLILFECLTGRRAIEGEPMEIVSGHLMDTIAIPSISALRSGLPREVDAVIAKATARDPAQRFQVAGELARALAAVPPIAVDNLPTLGANPSPALRSSGARKALTPQSLGGGTSVTPSGSAREMATSLSMSAGEITKGKKRSGAIGIAIGAIVLGGGAVAGWLTLHRAPSPPPLAATPAVAHLKLVGAPPGVRVSDARTPGVPLALQGGQLMLPRGNEPLVLAFEAEGFQPARQQVIPEGDSELVVHLVPVVVAPAPAPAPPRPTVHHSSGKPAEKKTEVDPDI